jgi:hypothetical protein
VAEEEEEEEEVVLEECVWCYRNSKVYRLDDNFKFNLTSDGSRHAFLFIFLKN